MSDRLGWVGSPNNRGTMDILWSCASTLGLCVWTAVHPNIELYPRSGRALSVRILMMLTAIVFPEIIISVALRQRMLASAKRVAPEKPPTTIVDESVAKTTGMEQTASTGVSQRRTHTSEDLSPQAQEDLKTSGAETSAAEVTLMPEPTSEKSKATASEIDLLSSSNWKREQLYFVVMGGLAVDFGEKYFLTVDALPFLKKAGCLPELSIEDVQEKSNADVITKLIVVIQTVWFAIQIVARLASGLTITALEIHTIVHVGCAIVMYILWWDKPYNVSRSVELRDPKARDIAALFVYKKLLDETYEEEVLNHERDVKQHWRRPWTGSLPTPPVRLSVSTVLNRNTDSTFLPAAQRGFQALSEVSPLLDQPFDGVRTSSENFTALRVWGSWTEDYGHDWTFDKLMHVLFNLLYGAGHLAAWDSTAFPTLIERWLWRASSLMLVSVLIWGTIWILFWKATRSRLTILKPIHSGELNLIVAPFFCVIMVCYVLARCYFLVEALIGLRSLPAPAYEVVRWTYFLPHAG